jgi:D-alanyl-D-alanine carboxypeptidase
VDDVIASAGPKLEARIGAYRRAHRLPGIAAGIATRDGLRWWHAAGFADLDTGRRPDQRTLYRIASISKTVTATAVLQLRDEGRFRLDDPAVSFIPELRRIRNPFGPIEDLTVRRLLMHTSGLQGEVPWQDLDRWWMYTPDELLAVLDRAVVATPPEVDGKYSNFAFELLGILVERVAGQPFQDRVRETILDPLGMNDTVWDPAGDQVDRRAVGYDGRDHDDRPPVARQVDSSRMRADGGLWSTLDDLGRWLGQQLRTDAGLERGGDQVLRASTLKEMHRPAFVTKPDLSEGQGLCWYAVRKGETVLVQHSGALWGYMSNASFSVEGRVGAIVLVNGMGDAASLARELIEDLLPAIKEAADRAADEPVPPCPDAYRELLGTYREPESMDDTRIEWRDGHLVMTDTSLVPKIHPLEPTADPLVFTILEGRPGGEPLVFSRGADGRIDRCNAHGYPAMRVGLLRPPTWI